MTAAIEPGGERRARRGAAILTAVAAVLLVLDRTGRPGLAGAVVAATTLPAVVTGPVLGAWLDRTSRRRVALGTNQVLLAASPGGAAIVREDRRRRDAWLAQRLRDLPREDVEVLRRAAVVLERLAAA